MESSKRSDVAEVAEVHESNKSPSGLRRVMQKLGSMARSERGSAMEPEANAEKIGLDKIDELQKEHDEGDTEFSNLSETFRGLINTGNLRREDKRTSVTFDEDTGVSRKKESVYLHGRVLPPILPGARASAAELIRLGECTPNGMVSDEYRLVILSGVPGKTGEDDSSGVDTISFFYGEKGMIMTDSENPELNGYNPSDLLSYIEDVASAVKEQSL